MAHIFKTCAYVIERRQLTEKSKLRNMNISGQGRSLYPASTRERGAAIYLEKKGFRLFHIDFGQNKKSGACE